MDRPKIDNETLSQARRLHNSGDLDAYKQPSKDDRRNKDLYQERLERDRAAFLRRGGKITHIAAGASGYDANKPKRHLIINAEKMDKRR